MPPRSTRSQTRSGAGPPLPPPLPPPPPPPQTAAVPVAPASTDLSFDFMAKVPSPVTLPSSQQALGTASSALSALSAMSGTSAMSAARLAAAPTPSSRDNPYDFLAMVPSPVTLPPLQPTRSAAATPSAPSVPPAAPPAAAASHAPCRSAAAPTLSSGNDPYDFIAKIPLPVTLPSSQPARSAAAAPPAVPPAAPTSAPPQSAAMLPPTTRTRSGAGAPHPPLVPSAPPALSQSTLPPSLGGGDAAIGLMANMPSQVMLPLSQSGQGSQAIRLSSITIISILTSHWTTYRLCLLIQSTLMTLKGSLCWTHRRRYVFQYFLIIKLMSHIQIGF